MTEINDLRWQTALAIAQQAIFKLSEWVDYNLREYHSYPPDTEVLSRAKKLVSWSESGKIQPLQVIFDQIKLSLGQTKQHYWVAKEIENKQPLIPYPQERPPSEADVNNYKLKIKQELQKLTDTDWQNLSLLGIIIEKYGSYLSFGEPDIALVDITRTTTAVAIALIDNPQESQLRLIAGDLSGIQNFIYTISSDGALKSLRARSFYLELVTEEVVQQLLNALNLPRSNVIYAGGGNLYILADAKEDTISTVSKICDQLNQWLLKEFQGKIFLTIDSKEVSVEDINNKKFAEDWAKVTKKLAKQKAQKFKNQINSLLLPQDSYEPCKVCHRDDVQNLKPLNEQEPDSVLACGTCRRMYRLGGQLFRVEAIVRSSRNKITGSLDQLLINNSYYHLFSSWSDTKKIEDDEVLYLVNDWTIEHYRRNNTVCLLLGNYGKQKENEPDFISTSEMTNQAKGIKRVGYLRMDVDKLGQIFAKGLGEKQTLPRLAGLSRQMSYYFKVYLNTLASSRQENLIDKINNVKYLTKSDRPNLLFIYAGGDDLFVSGAWNEVVEFAFDVYQSFRAYTAYNPDITISAGISLANAKFPLYQAAEESGEAEEKAKGNGRDSLGLFGQVFKWNEWLGNKVIDSEIEKYLTPIVLPDLFGVFPFVQDLQKIDISYSRNFIRNLLITAEVQEKMLSKAKDKNKTIDEQKDIRYFLHLPKIAYTLTRLPEKVKDNPSFQPVKTGLKSPYNAPYFRAIATWLELLNRSE